MKEYALLILTILCFSCEENAQDSTKIAPKAKQLESEQDKALRFYQALNQGDAALAVEVANSLDLAAKQELEKAYDILFTDCKVERDFFEDPKFSVMDFVYWQQALLFKNESAKIVNSFKDGENVIELCYNVVRDRINGVFDGPDASAFPIDIWQRKYGVCDRQSWVMCELAYQLGAEVFIIYFMNPETGISHHTICEIIYQGEKYIVDPLYGKFLKGVHLRDINDQRLKEIWPDHPELFGGLEKAKILSPSMPFDYSLRQQSLAAFLKNHLPKDQLMRFGEEPRKRATNWPFMEGDDIWFWDYPVRLLSSAGLYKKLYPKKTTE